jgi:hypothetical protein
MPNRKPADVKWHQLNPQGPLVGKIRELIEDRVLQHANVTSACLQIPREKPRDKRIRDRVYRAALPLVILNLESGYCRNNLDKSEHAGNTAYLVVSQTGIHQKCRSGHEVANCIGRISKQCSGFSYLVGSPCASLKDLLKGLIPMVDMLRD